MVRADDSSLKMPENLLIIGAGGHGSEVCAYIEAISTANGLRLLGFIDDNRPRGPWLGSDVLGGLADLEVLARSEESGVLRYITAFGDNCLRHRAVRTIEKFGFSNLRPYTVRHPSSQVGPEVQIGEGTLLAPNTIVTTRAKIGKHSILNVRVSVSHDCVINDFVNINPGAVICGRVEIGCGAYIGAGAVVKDRVRIGRGAIVGAGAVVIHDLPDGVTAVGVPARIIKEAPTDWLES